MLTPTPIDQLPPECRLAGKPRYDLPLGLICDANGLIVSVRYEDDSWRAVTRDAHGNALVLTNSIGEWEWYTRDASGRVLSYERSDGACYKATYDTHGNVLASRNNKGKWYTYTRDDDGTAITYEEMTDITSNAIADSRKHLTPVAARAIANMGPKDSMQYLCGLVAAIVMMHSNMFGEDATIAFLDTLASEMRAGALNDKSSAIHRRRTQ